MNHEIMKVIKKHKRTWRLIEKERHKNIKGWILKSKSYEGMILERVNNNLVALAVINRIPLRSSDVMAFNLTNPAQFLWKK